MRYRSTIIAVLVLLASLPLAAANSGSVTAKTKTIAAFKNGLGFFLQEGEANLTDGWAVSEALPAAALGTYWVGSAKAGVSVERLVALQEDETKTVPAASIQEMLEANVGKFVSLTVGDKLIEGKLTAAPSTVALIETPRGTVAVNKNSISWVQFAGTADANRSVTEKVKRLKFKINGAKDKAPVTIGYLQKGITWSPAYLVELLDNGKARLTMQGLLANDVEDIDGADVYFVVGYPNFMFANILSPLTLTQSVTDFVQSLSNPQQPRYGMYGGMVQAQMTANYAGYDYEAAAPRADFGYSTGTETPGAPEEDLFLYQIKDASLKKGERAYYTVFTAEVPYEHIYEWAVPDSSGVQPNGYVETNMRPEQISPENQVWHKLRLTNSSKYPWTTAPGMAISNGQPLSQDMLAYTPKGAKGDLKVTIATDIKADQSEVETGRVPDALKGYNWSYTKVTSDGELTVKSFKTRPVTVTIKKTLIGEVVTASDDGKVQKVTKGLKAVNPTSVITWDVPLKPGEQKKVSYTYFTYVRY